MRGVGRVDEVKLRGWRECDMMSMPTRASADAEANARADRLAYRLRSVQGGDENGD